MKFLASIKYKYININKIVKKAEKMSDILVHQTSVNAITLSCFDN